MIDSRVKRSSSFEPRRPFPLVSLASAGLLVVISIVLGCQPTEDASRPSSTGSSSNESDSGSASTDSQASDASAESQSSEASEPADSSSDPLAAPEPETSEPAVPESNEATTETQTPDSDASGETTETMPSEEPAVVSNDPPLTTPSATSETNESDEPALQEAPEYEGWDDPVLALFITGRQNGYIEPCGCTGLANQKGGLLRRDTMLTQLRERGWEMVPLDLGNQEHRFGAQATIKFTKTVEALAGTMNYAAIGLGPDDLRLPSTDLVQAIENSGAPENIFASANVALFGDYLPKVRILERAGHKLGVTSVLGPKAMAQVNNADAELIDLPEAIPAAVALMTEAACELKILMCYATVEETEEIVKSYPQFDLVICSGVDGEPTIAPSVLEVGDRKIPIVQTGVKGMYVGVVGWFPGQDEPLKYQRVALDGRFADSERIKRIFIDYQAQLETMGLEGLDLVPVSHPSGRTFVGSATCGECHTTAFEIWKNGVDGSGGPHSHATASLTEPNERTWVKRFHDPECLSCHTTGWNPQKYFPYEGGFVGLEESQAMFGNGCENCHGPGSDHVAAENGDIETTAEELKEFQAQMRVKLDATQCMECHDLDNSPDFHEPGAFEKYWARIIHEGKD